MNHITVGYIVYKRIDDLRMHDGDEKKAAYKSARYLRENKKPFNREDQLRVLVAAGFKIETGNNAISKVAKEEEEKKLAALKKRLAEEKREKMVEECRP